MVCYQTGANALPEPMLPLTDAYIRHTKPRWFDMWKRNGTRAHVEYLRRLLSMGYWSAINACIPDLKTVTRNWLYWIIFRPWPRTLVAYRALSATWPGWRWPWVWTPLFRLMRRAWHRSLRRSVSTYLTMLVTLSDWWILTHWLKRWEVLNTTVDLDPPGTSCTTLNQQSKT